MAYNKSRKKSFFAEQREGNSNPNFINNMDPAFIKQNVKRIIKDISEQIIIPEDYIYFRNNNVINACKQESFEQFQIAQTMRHALMSYRTIILPNNMIVDPSIDVNLDYTLTAIELTKICDRENIWASANRMFIDIANGADPQSVLFNITRFPKQSIKNL